LEIRADLENSELFNWKSVPTKKCVSECGNGIPFPILYTADI